MRKKSLSKTYLRNIRKHKMFLVEEIQKGKNRYKNLDLKKILADSTTWEDWNSKWEWY